MRPRALAPEIGPLTPPAAAIRTGRGVSGLRSMAAAMIWRIVRHLGTRLLAAVRFQQLDQPGIVRGLDLEGQPAGLAQESGSASHNYYFASLFLVCGKAGPRWRSPGGRKPTRGSAMVNTRNTASQMICQAIVQRPSWSLGLSNRHRP